MKKEKVSHYVRKKIYRYPALTPKSPVARIALYQFPRTSKVENKSDEIVLTFKAENPDAYKFALIYAARKDRSTLTSQPENILSKIHLNSDL